jgi:hypothetical protein
MTETTLLQLSALAVLAFSVVAFWQASRKPIKVRAERLRRPRR